MIKLTSFFLNPSIHCQRSIMSWVTLKSCVLIFSYGHSSWISAQPILYVLWYTPFISKSWVKSCLRYKAQKRDHQMLSCEFQNMQIAEFFLNFARNLSVENSSINQYTLPSPLPTGQNWPLGTVIYSLSTCTVLKVIRAAWPYPIAVPSQLIAP